MEDSLKQHLVLARDFYEKHEYANAEPHLLEVLKIADSYADVHNMLGVVHHDRGDFQEARKHFERALEINPNYTEASLNLAVTYNDLGLYSEARQTYAHIRERAESGVRHLDPFARGKLSNMHAEVGHAYADFGLYPEAAAEYRKALWLSPHFADIRTKLGNVMRDMGDIDGACVEYREAIRNNPKYVAARVLLGVAFLSVGKREQAQKQWEEALVVDPENKTAQMYLRMLKGNTLQSQPPPPPRPSQTGMEAIRLAESRTDIKAQTPSKPPEKA